jgi:hypothetical protein
MITDKELAFWDGKTTTRIALSSAAAMEPLARAFTQLLTANRAALEKDFTMTFRSGDAGDAWSLQLAPTGPALKKIIAAIEIEGRGIELSVLRVRETNSDVSTTHFSSVDAAKRYTDAELDRLFRVPPQG